MTNRRHLLIPIATDTIVATIDDAPNSTGLLIVTGGNETRAGTHRGMSLLAAKLAATGTPIFRYDRRGTGDSTGPNTGYAGARKDLLAAADAFREHAPHLTRLIAFGNCDAATTLALWGKEAGCDQVILANPWVVEPRHDLPPPAAIKAHYAARLRDPSAWKQIAKAGLSIPKLIKGLRSIATAVPTDDLTTRALAAITAWGDDATVILATGDATAIAYADAASRAGLTPTTIKISTSSHSFARPADVEALETAIRSLVTPDLIRGPASSSDVD